MTNANTDSQAGSTDCATGAGDDEIELPAGVYALTLGPAGETGNAGGDLDVHATLTIRGAGALSTALDGGGADRVLQSVGGALTLEDLTVRGGSAPEGGAGIWVVSSGGLIVNRCRVVDNHAAGDSSGLAGGIGSFSGALIVLDSEIRGNTATASGNVVSATTAGGVWCSDCAFTRSAIVGNTASANAGSSSAAAGGIFKGGVGAFSLLHSTVSGNDATAAESGSSIAVGGFWHAAGSSTLSITSSTIADNTATGAAGATAIFEDGGGNTFTFVNSLVVGTCSNGVFASGGGNLESPGDTCGFGLADQTDVADPGLAPLAWNGGPTPTHDLLPGSPALESADDTQCGTVDQRGAVRPSDGDLDGTPQCDVGAFERGFVITQQDFEIGTVERWSDATPD